MALKRLSQLIRSRLPIRRATEILAAEPVPEDFLLLPERIGTGIPLSDALDELGHLSPGTIAIIRTGEEHGRIEDALEEAALYEGDFSAPRLGNLKTRPFRLPQELTQWLKQGDGGLVLIEPELHTTLLRLIKSFQERFSYVNAVSWFPQTGIPLYSSETELEQTLRGIPQQGIFYLDIPRSERIQSCLEHVMDKGRILLLPAGNPFLFKNPPRFRLNLQKNRLIIS